jgi:hypothetical protein
LNEVLEKLHPENEGIVQKYCRFKAHVCRQVYADVELATDRLPEREAAWPQNEKTKLLVSRPTYLSQRDNVIAQEERASAGREWLKTNLQHVQTIQELKQHHIHLPNEKGERLPLTHCKRPDNPMKCKGDFPRKSWLIDKAVVLCKGLLDRMGLPSWAKK